MPPSSVDHITVKGFKSISCIEDLELKPINILVGANGSGKSNFIGLFSFLRDIREGKLQDYVTRSGGAEQILHFGSKATKSIEISISFREQTNGYRLNLAPTNTDSLYPLSEAVSFWDKASYPQPYIEHLFSTSGGMEAGISATELKKTPSWVRGWLNSWRLYHVHDTSSSSPMRKTSNIDDNSFLRPDGSNLASFLYLLKLKEESSYQLIRQATQRVAPFFDDFNLNPSQLNTSTIKLEWKHKHSDSYFDVSSLSDGTLRFITLATLFLQPFWHLPSLILVDEPELGLHPYAIGMLASLIKQASTKTQVLIATQSPQLLDSFAPSDILVADRVGEGTKIRRLNDIDLASWLEDYSLGQLWEKNEFAGRPG